MPETLLTQSAVKMYGRVLQDVTLVSAGAASSPSPPSLSPPSLSTNSTTGPAPYTYPAALGYDLFLRNQLVDPSNNVQRAPEVRLAKIYAFSFEGAFYNLPRPAIFLVHGPGRAIVGAGTYDAGGGPNAGNTVMNDSGIPAREFIFETDVVYWEYDKDDLSLRLDSFSGTLEDILIEAALSSTSRSGIVSRSGIQARSGAASDAEESMRHRLR
jgi:hypothetical protein